MSGGGMGLRWQDWLDDFEDFMKGSQITDPEQCLIALRNLVRKEAGQIIKELPQGTATSYHEVQEALNKRFQHKKNRL